LAISEDIDGKGRENNSVLDGLVLE